MKTHTCESIEIAVMRALCNHQRSSYSEHVVKTLNADPKGLSALELDPRDYNLLGSSKFSDSYLLYSFLRKWEGYDGKTKDREKVTVDSWQAAERQCFITNKRLADDICAHKAPLNLISLIQRKVQYILGASPPDEILSNCKWSGGATYDMRKGSLIQDKMCSDISLTKDFLPLWHSQVDNLWAAVVGEPNIVSGNRCVQVPKNANINRMISAEPTGNAFAQQSVGQFIRRRLRTLVGIDLNDQKVNQRLAFEALVRELCTIDLKMASDTLALLLVKLLTPTLWFELLDALRSKKSYLGGKWYVLNKFSSMGNAFTFELESLIFWAITSAVSDLCKPNLADRVVSVYGDDIICDQEIADDVVGALQYFGFTVNTEKSYFAGSKFFESCGRHYFDLEDVTPVYQKAVVGDDLFEIIAFHNRLFRWFKRNPRSYSEKILGMIEKFLKEKHPKLKKIPRTPFIEADMGLISDGLSPNRNGDYKCDALVTVTNPQYLLEGKFQDALYAYKLRRGSRHLNGTPEGYCSDEVYERRVLKTTTVWGSQVLIG